MGRKFEVKEIGQIKRDGKEKIVQIEAQYRPALKGLDSFSHVIVFWWADKFEEEPEYRDILVADLPYAEGIQAGMFACHSPIRPNLIMATVCEMISVDEGEGIVEIVNLDALDGTPVIDLKPYFPVTHRVKEATISPWLEGWPEWFPEEGIGLEPYEEA